MTKICSKCGEEKPATTEYFWKSKGNKDGLRGQCKVCKSKRMKQWRQENKEHNKQLMKQWRQENKEYMKQWRQENKEHIKERMKQYRQENKESRRQYNQKREAFKKRLSCTLTLDQWEKIKNDFNNECAYCGKTEQEHKEEFNEQLHQEHFIPLTKGGEYTYNNIIPSCRSCNSSKQDTDFFEWYPTYEEYNEEREQFILEYLGYIEDTQQLTLEVEIIERGLNG